MANYSQLATQYYDAFHRYDRHVGFFTRHTLFVFTSFLLFAALSVWLLAWIVQKRPGSEVTILGVLTASSEILFLFAWDRAKRCLERSAVSKLDGAFGIKAADGIYEVKRQWLKNTLGDPPTEYASLAAKISRAADLEEKHKVSVGPTWTQLLLLIFHPESKARIISLIVVLLSIIGLILVRSFDFTQPLSDLFWSDDFGRYMGTWFSIGFVLWFAWLGLVFAVEFLSAAALEGLDQLTRGASLSKRAKARLIQALIEYHEVSRQKHRLRSGEGAE
ncbi:hypothetical protein ATO7_10918 [Oceanococcus atlanticus]|uniref:Uncharacterized protein n=1 Tax=Oceanococcus atlanticus TaxID=1317117 RepID=A0A1Y1SAZ7_9GAMM|nr:hypothetical protein [Oceanococcus atlanticus]ORE85799.1 hypothetical protein ATO7_10918 [Oceanococcus atlanticus]